MKHWKVNLLRSYEAVEVYAHRCNITCGGALEFIFFEENSSMRDYYTVVRAFAPGTWDVVELVAAEG